MAGHSHSNRPEKAKHRMDYAPRWTRYTPKRDRQPDDLRPVPQLELAAGVADEVDALAADFVATMGDDPKPTAEQVADRIRHVLRHARDTQQKVVVVSRPTPPYFGVATQRAAVEVEEVKEP